MKLSEIAGEDCRPDPVIAGLTADSRAIKKGFLFAALPGTQIDGARFIPQAEEKGAAAILARPGAKTRLPLVEDDNPRRRLSRMAAAFYPSQPSLIAGVTGTNGKTSTALFAAQLWRRLGKAAGSLGTLGASGGGYSKTLAHTTPEPVMLHQTLSEMTAAGVTHLAMEVSSHGLAQHRADGVAFAVAAFTNITQDHLDYHRDFDDYFRAKARLFDALTPSSGAVVVNADGAGAERIMTIARKRGLRLVTVGAAGDDLRLADVEPLPTGLRMAVQVAERRFDLKLPLVGRFQAENALLAAGIVIAAGEHAPSVLPLLETLSGAPGRMQHVAALTFEGGDAGVYVDYAHTPDAVATALQAIRPHAAGRVIAIIGAGGDRDQVKRPLMGKAAQAHADSVIVTDDNPRSEEPAVIRKAVLEGCPGAL
ncbi:MAG: UDP-N-acetylmuramoyl-L-alanyl-D-glutamate--2,6-diaminopimelate ligase, partial [Hyphococcus sp.]